MTAQNFVWFGSSGQPYTFEVHPSPIDWNNIGGIYIFASLSGGGYTAWYVGETENYKTRLVTSHEKWKCAQGYGANCVHTLVAENEDTRLAIERDLIAALQPACNDQLKGGLLDLLPAKH